MGEDRKEMLTCEIINQIPDLFLAELVQVADFVRRLKTSRNFTASAEFDK